MSTACRWPGGSLVGVVVLCGLVVLCWGIFTLALCWSAWRKG